MNSHGNELIIYKVIRYCLYICKDFNIKFGRKNLTKLNAIKDNKNGRLLFHFGPEERKKKS